VSQAVHVGWRDYPETDPAIAARFHAPSDMGATLALEASRLLGRYLIAYREIFKPDDSLMLGETRLIDIGLIAAARWLDADRLWALQIGYRAIGFGGVGRPTPYGVEQVAAMGVEVRPLPSGFCGADPTRRRFDFHGRSRALGSDVYWRPLVREHGEEHADG
jgi:hypothetical protein